MTAPQPTFSVSYALFPPPGVEDLPTASGSKLPKTTSTITYPVFTQEDPSNFNSSTSQQPHQVSKTSQHYNALSETLKIAQKELNDNLTLWKDAIGDREKSKEDPGTIGFGRGKAAMMSEDVGAGKDGQVGEGDDSDSSEDS